MLGGVSDTHPLVWFATNQRQKLGGAARRIFEAADRRDGSGLIVIPSIVLHEVSSLLIANRVTLGRSFADWVTSIERHGFFQIIDVTADMVVQSSHLQAITDPFDRLIMGCSLLLEQPLITIDQQITDSHLVETVWD